MSLFTLGGRSKQEPRADSPGDDGEERTVRIARRRFVRRRWTRRWLKWRRLAVLVVVLALVVGGGWLVFFSPVLAVAGTQVTGTRLLARADVRAAAAVPTGVPLATIDLAAVEKRVERLPAVKSVDVSRAWPDRVRLDVTERRAVAVVEPVGGGRLRGIDASGVQFRDFATRPKKLPMIRSGSSADTAALAEAATVAGSLPAGLAARVSYVEVRSLDRITLSMRSGHQVLWGSAGDSRDKARVLDVLLGQKACYYDVSVAGQPVIRRCP
jgi:cell division protein FtsQ